MNRRWKSRRNFSDLQARHVRDHILGGEFAVSAGIIDTNFGTQRGIRGRLRAIADEINRKGGLPVDDLTLQQTGSAALDLTGVDIDSIDYI